MLTSLIQYFHISIFSPPLEGPTLDQPPTEGVLCEASLGVCTPGILGFLPGGQTILGLKIGLLNRNRKLAIARVTDTISPHISDTCIISEKRLFITNIMTQFMTNPMAHIWTQSKTLLIMICLCTCNTQLLYLSYNFLYLRHQSFVKVEILEDLRVNIEQQAVK